MIGLIKGLWNEEEAQGMVEYGLIMVLVSLVAIFGLGVLGEQLNTFFEEFAEVLNE